MYRPTEIRPTRSSEQFLPVNGVDLCVQTFGDPTDPAMLLVGNTMLTWDDELCERLARGGRAVVCYDLRDTGRSTIVDPDAPGYDLRELARDAVGLLDALDLRRAHVVGFGPGGWVAQLIALDHRDRIATLTLISTRPTAPGPADPDLPEHSPQMMSHLMSAPPPDWSDRGAVIDFVVEGKRHLTGAGAIDAAAVRARVGRIADRTIAAAPAGADLGPRHRADQMGTVFAALDCRPRWRERLGEITAPTLVIHGTDDPFFPLGNGEALAAEIPGAELLTLPGTGHELPAHTWDVVVAAILRHTAP